MERKKVLLLVVDGCTPSILDAGIAAGRLPRLRELCEAGFYDRACASIYPSITPAATASIVTGTYPNEHGVVGAHWYHPETGEVAYYGDDLTVIREKGTKEFLEDFLVGLNARQLTGETLFDSVERAGLRAACINHLIFRGLAWHEARVPLPMRLLPGVPQTLRVPGPSLLYLGDFVSSPLPDGRQPKHASGLWHRLGMDDAGTTDVLLQLVEAGLPELTLAYFPDYDYRAHAVGPIDALPALEALDGHLGRVFEAAGGLDALLRDCCVVLTADHSMSKVARGDRADLPLDRVLSLRVAEAGKPWGDGDELKVCVNMRTAQLYFREPNVDRFVRAARELLEDTRVDQLLWKGFEGSRPVYEVVTRGRGGMRFRAGEGGGTSACDDWGALWSWDGELAAVDGEVCEDGILRFGTYPNAFERIACALDAPGGGHLWATSVPGVEFTVAETEPHAGGGAHGSLHAKDSLVPLVAAGLPAGLELRAPTRIVDVVPLCLGVLGLEPARPIGASHVATPAQRVAAEGSEVRSRPTTSRS